ncbi:DNA-methyltransferase [Bacillus paralicheniformis]|uniref:DNA-methyltransferase n=1 Tax=Bacillus paralicheniformis TaxID=1648923 RepID=UPI001C0F14DC|nr:site-specific DNA-methyltransferase [Bacillus paralicheniformis]MBU5327666.1 site-specific DNA-methyltransferase [Bacillus paralicheniformis]
MSIEQMNNLYDNLNKIIQMDCIEGMKLLPDKSVNMILTDIPYDNVTRNGEERAKNAGQLRVLNKGEADILTFDLEEFLAECYRISNGSIYIFCGIEQMSDIFSYFDSKKDMITRQCIWHKTNPSPLNAQHYWVHSFENCIYAKKRKSTYNDGYAHNVWDFPIERKVEFYTPKPLKLFKCLIEKSTNRGDLVLDPCIGSGTTGLACKELKRDFIGFDLNAEFVELANRRLEL